ncbi:sporulation integral membrane protein YtvI [Alkalicoccobacillus murimartini]|uniref:Sporulation integral membrane protein YtvI n=1 Tax=Alkalicoccobacillus murimartini TaxID=171685 RepID=A0ABT9YHA6_9BACI|nr:sporulation integral membrane protein YtvI [Alkalicoccobacillus murimartini]MDQ0207248.1 sporulation integral membrane protein YtvI [Alkalicoccobacillus murimartini]
MFNPVLVKRILTLIAAIAIVVFVYINFSVFLPILLALLTAMIFEPFVKMLKKHLKSEKRILPVTIVFTLFLTVGGYLLYLTLTRLVTMIYMRSLEIPHYAREIQIFIDDFIITFNQTIAEIPQGNQIVRELERQSEALFDKAVSITSDILATSTSVLTGIPNMLFVLLIYVITLFLFSLDLPRLLNLFFNLFKMETASKLRFVFQRMSKVFLGYWKAQFILSVGVFIVTYVSLLFISPESALLMSVLIWLVDIIPLYVGPALILVPWGILAMILGSTSTGLQLMILAVVLLLVRRIIEPKVLGDSIGLAALPTVLSMYFGYVFFGVLGLILGPFVYIAIRSAKEAGLFELNLTGDLPNQSIRK